MTETMGNRAGTAVVTGSTKGLGRGLAEALLKRGWRVVVSGRDAEDSALVAQALTDATGQTAIGQACEVADKAQVQALWDLAAERLGGIDLWINNAGLARGGIPFLDLDDATLREMVDVNIFGALHGSQVALAGMSAQYRQGWIRQGRICNVLGGGADGRVFPGMVGYGITKRAAHYLTRALAMEAEGKGVFVSGLMPGIVITEAVFRESQKIPPAMRPLRLQGLNTMADHVEDACDWAVEQILDSAENGALFQRLSKPRIYWRLLRAKFNPRGIVDRYEFWPADGGPGGPKDKLGARA